MMMIEINMKQVVKLIVEKLIMIQVMRYMEMKKYVILFIIQIYVLLNLFVVNI
jgi:hypothetical protein